MKTARNSLFETNSSSIHSMSYTDNPTFELPENTVIELKYFDDDEYSSIEDMLALLSIALIWKYDFDKVYGYLNEYYINPGYSDIVDDLELKNFKAVLNQRGMKHVEFRWDEHYGCSCDDGLMDTLHFVLKESQKDIIDFIEHTSIEIFDRDSER